jgi:hypothetical protein
MPPQRLRGRALLVTVIDASLITAASAALVVLLGGRSRFELLDTTITIRGATNLIVFAVIFGGLRLLFGRRLRPLPALPLPTRAALDAERARLAMPCRAALDVWLHALATLLGSVVWIVPHLRDIRQVPEPGDPVFSAWRIARLAYQFTHDPGRLFDGNIFYPLPLTLTYSDATLLQGFLGMPFVLAGVDPLIVANALTLIAFPLCGLAVFYAAWRLTGDPGPALIAGLVGAWYPFHAEHYNHLELQWGMFIPLAIVAGLRMLADPGAATGARFGAAVTAQWLASMYLGVMLLSFLAPFMAIVAVAWRVTPTRRIVMAVAAAAAIVLPALLAVGAPYVKSREMRGERSLKEVSDYSAAARDYGRANIRLVAYRWQSRHDHRSERELYPGTSTLTLAAAGIVPPFTGATIGTLVAGALAFDWSLGLKGLTYDELFKRSFVYRGMRVPARFSAIVGAALALLAGYGARRVLRAARTPLTRSVLCSGLALIVLFDLRLDPGVQRYWSTIPSIYGQVTPKMVLAELPSDRQIEYMYFSTSHWARLLGGYSGYAGPSSLVHEGWGTFPSASALDSFRRAGATHLTYNCAMEKTRERCAEVLEFLEGSPSLAQVASERWAGGDVRLYRFR